MIKTDSGHRGLTRPQIAALRDAVGRGTWTLDEFTSYDGEATVLLTHNATETTLVISGPADRIELFELQDDRLLRLGLFAAVAAAAAFVANFQLHALPRCQASGCLSYC